MPISYQAIYPVLKGHLAERAGFGDQNDIYADWRLTGHPLGYDVRGKRALASAINALFPAPPRIRALIAPG